MTAKGYRAFISYSHADERWGRWLHRALETYSIPRHLVGKATAMGPVPARLAPIFRDRDELASAADLSSHIRDALAASDNLIVICSPAAARSRWVNEEIRTFQAAGRAARVFCVIVAGEPAEGDDEDCFPPSLRLSYDETGKPIAGRLEPLAADARANGDGRTLALLKVVAGLIGVDLDELRRRDAQRRQRRMAIITGVSLAGVSVTTALAVTAYFARNEAEQRREQAEDLLSFMVGDLRERLTPIGRLDVLEDVGTRALAYFATVAPGDLTDEELTRHAQVLTQIGEIRMSQRQYDDALTAFRQAAHRAAELARKEPGDGKRLFRRAQAEFWMGYVDWRRGDIESAHGWLTRYRDSALGLVKLAPDRTEWIQEVAYGHHNLAVLEFESANLEAARHGFESELAVLTELDRSHPELDLGGNIADAISWLGNIAYSGGALADAKAHFQRSADQLERIFRADPENAHKRYDHAHALLWVSDVASVTDDVDGAIRLVDRALGEFNELSRLDPQNKEWLRASAHSRISRGYLLASVGDASSARKHADDARAVLELLLKEENSDLKTREQLARAYYLRALADYAAGDIAAALRANEAAIENLQTLEATTELTDRHRGIFGSVQVLQGRLRTAVGDRSAAQAHWQRAIGLLKKTAATATSPDLSDPLVRALTYANLPEEARQVRDRLETSGYRPLWPWPPSKIEQDPAATAGF
jgi:tetratricopeptide (TPR) repeat protein